ncbi:MAG: DUF2141 domain-containing protein [Flavobacteriaceae bacterium]
MKNLGITILFAIITFGGFAQQQEGVTVTLTIENVLNDSGTILASLHTRDSFMKGPGIANTMTKAETGETVLTFENIVPGTYAIMVLHDANDNKQMDFDETNMPKEHYATSGDMNPYGPPTFDGAKFVVSEKNLDLTLRF